jgi:hypothetical protein
MKAYPALCPLILFSRRWLFQHDAGSMTPALVLGPLAHIVHAG